MAYIEHNPNYYRDMVVFCIVHTRTSRDEESIYNVHEKQSGWYEEKRK